MAADCDSSALIPVETILHSLLAHARPVPQTETLPLEQASGRVLACDLEAQIDIPPFHASAMDGYAVDSQNLGTKQCIPVTQRIIAGQQYTTALQPGSAARIFTGAPLPEGADSVVMQESCVMDGNTIKISTDVQPGQFVRFKGSHIKKGDIYLTKGHPLGPAAIGLGASIGIDKITVYRRLNVTLLTTGNELMAPGTILKPGQIYDANQYLLNTLLGYLNCNVTIMTPAKDNLLTVKSVLQQACSGCDLIITTGGVSVGEEDHIRTAVEDLGELVLWRARVKPGKPFSFGHVQNTPFIGLPGNPMSAFVTFCLFARPFILCSQGLQETAPKSFPVLAGFQRQTADQRREYMRVTLKTDVNGQQYAYPHPNQDSGTLLSAVQSDGLLCIPEQTTVVYGAPLSYIPFAELINFPAG